MHCYVGVLRTYFINIFVDLFLQHDLCRQCKLFCSYLSLCDLGLGLKQGSNFSPLSGMSKIQNKNYTAHRENLQI